MNEKLVEESINILKSYNYSGERNLENGSLLIAKAPHIAPQAWLHRIYAPINDNDISILEKELNQEIPNVFKEFLMISNGLSVFNTVFTLEGRRFNYKRTGDDVWQPFDIITPNTIEKPRNADKNIFIIGGYDWDGSYLYIDKRNETVHLCKNDDVTSLFEWANFENMLFSEINRLSNLFDKNGKKMNVEESTLPC